VEKVGYRDLTFRYCYGIPSVGAEAQMKPVVLLSGIKGNARDKVLKYYLDHPELEGKYTELDVQHDYWCAIYKGSDTCNCNPDIVVIAPHD
jgi:hypothetical protein